MPGTRTDIRAEPDERPARDPPVRYLPRIAGACSHLDQIAAVAPDADGVCPDCVAIGGRWVHLRMCRSCGHVGCCDDSPNRHATAHFQATGHPVIRSLEAGEKWSWCYVDEVVFRLPGD